MRVDLFDFDLPDSSIALRPANPRDSARLLEVRPDDGPDFHDRHVFALPEVLRAGDVLVVNNTKVIPGQLAGLRQRQNVDGSELTAKVSITLHKKVSSGEWLAFAKPAKKIEPGDRLIFDALFADVVGKRETGEIHLAFNKQSDALLEELKRIGEMPLPPYIATKRAQDERDSHDYQTVYAKEQGAVAAPTAGLHLTDDLMERLRADGIDICEVTLHVGAGTFLPVKSDDTDNHKMHSETGTLSEESAVRINNARNAGGRVIAVGTTSLRILESATDEKGRVHPFAGSTDIFITPGYKFRAIDALLTNFHLPRSTLFMLVSAFCGLDCMQKAYRHALDKGYRFYSYGDASLLWKSARS